jgi:hypothetical protein
VGEWVSESETAVCMDVCENGRHAQGARWAGACGRQLSWAGVMSDMSGHPGHCVC